MKTLLMWFGFKVVRLSERLCAFGYGIYRKYATDEQRIAFVNERLRPLGIEVYKPDPKQPTNQEVLDAYLEKHARELGGGYGN